MDKNIAKRRRRLYLNILASSYLLLGGLSYGQATEYTITTVAGTGLRGFSGDGGFATDAQLARARYAAVNNEGNGNLYIADTLNNVIRMVNAGGVITTVVGKYSCTNDDAANNKCGGYDGDVGDAVSAQLHSPFQIAFDSGNLYIADMINNRIRKVNLGTDRIITTIAGNGCPIDGKCSGLPNGDGGKPTDAAISWPLGLGFRGNDLYIAEYSSSRIRKIANYNSINPSIRTVAGNGTFGSAGDGGLAISAQINGPRAIALDSKGNLYIADTDNNLIRKVDTSGSISTYVGTGIGNYGGDGTCGKLTTEVRLNWPRGVFVDRQDNLYISDTLNRRIRKVDTQGCITTIAGNGWEENRGDGGLATQASFVQPMGISMDNQGNIYVADPGGYKIRKLTPKDNSSPVPLRADGVIECGNPMSSCVSGQAPLTVQLTSTGSSNSKYQYLWKDSLEPSLSVSGELASLTLKLGGTHKITLTVTDDKGATASKDFSVTVSANAPPVAQFTINPTQGMAPLTVTADASQSKDPDGDPIKSYSWEYYDKSNPSTKTSKKIPENTTSFKFGVPGTYCITLVVEDDKGATSPMSAEKCITVNDPPVVSLVPKEIPDASLCGDFDVTIQVQAPQEQGVSSAELHLTFDPAVLQVKSGGIKAHDELNELVSQFDNNQGKINLALYTKRQTKPKGVFDLVTITFTARKSAANTVLSFDPQKTIAISPEGKFILQHKDPIIFTVKDAGVLKGQVKFQPGYVSKVVDLRIHVGNDPQTYKAKTDNNGIFTIGLPPGKHDVYVAETNTIQIMQPVTVTSGVCNPKNLVTFNEILYAGDVMGVPSTRDFNGDKITDPDPTNNSVGMEDGEVLIHFKDGDLLSSQFITDYNLDGTFKEDDDMSDSFLRRHLDLDNDGEFNFDKEMKLWTDSEFKIGKDKPSADYVKSAKNLRSRLQPLTLAIDDLAVNDSFDVAVEMEIDDIQPVFGAEAHLNFDSNLLQVNQIKAGDHFDSAPGNHFDNESGEIHFAAAQMNGKEPVGSFVLMTINCTLLGVGGDQSLTVDTNRTKAIFHLRPVLRKTKAYVTAIYAAPSSLPTNPPALAVELLNFTAEPNESGVVLTWQTATERDNAGFNILRSEQRMGEYVQLNNSLIPTRGNNEGATYSFVDNTIIKGKVYYYQLQDISFSENRTLHGPVSFITIRSPEDNAFFTSGTIPTFAWTHDSQSSLSIEYYYGDEPQKVYTMPINGTTLTPVTEKWQAFAEEAKGRTVFWRIVGNNTSSETRRFIVTN
jgi:PKD repeat protein